MPKSGTVAGIAAVLFVAFAGLLLAGWPDERTATVVTSLVSVAVAALAAVLAALAAGRVTGRSRAAWLALTIGLTAATVGEAVWAYIKTDAHTAPSSPLAGAVYLLFPVGVVTALLLFPSRRNHLSQSRVLLDAVIVAASLLIVSWLTVVQPAYATGSMTPRELAASLAYPVSNVVALIVATMVLVRTAEDRQRRYLTLGLACITLPAFAYAYLSDGNEYLAGRVIDLGWLAGMLLIVLAAAHGHRATATPDGTPEEQGWVSILAPYTALLLAGVVAAAAPQGHLASGVVLTAGTVLVVAVLVRQILLTNEDRRRLATVADQAARDPLTGLEPSGTAGGGPVVAGLLGELRQAIDRAALTLVYQPKFDAHTCAIVGVEALLRWHHPDRGLLSPEEFLPLVRRHRLTGGITDLVVNRALDDASRWQAAGLDVPVAVNLFGPSLGNLNLPGKIGQALTDRGLAASALTIEITEDPFDDIERAQTVLNDLSERGIRIAIDDFGTGYSALSYLIDLPVDEVKLDRTLVTGILADRRAAMVVAVVTDLAHRLNLVTVAEGVDNAELAMRLRDLGCDVLQGHYLSPPLTVDELLGALRESKAALRQIF